MSNQFIKELIIIFPFTIKDIIISKIHFSSVYLFLANNYFKKLNFTSTSK